MRARPQCLGSQRLLGLGASIRVDCVAAADSPPNSIKLSGRAVRLAFWKLTVLVMVVHIVV